MECPGCQRENREEARFCDGCGASLRPGCASCGQELRAGAAFCDACGQRVGEAPAAAPAPPAPPATDPSTTAFAGGRYRIQRFIGEGAKKRVYLARDTRLARDVALALIKSEGLDPETRARVAREVQAMGRLGDHPHVVTAFDVGEEAGQLYIVSQYMAGGALDERLRATSQARLPLDEVLRIAGQICGALAHAHARGIVHRDLKPGNVWLDESGDVRLGDFGLALSSQHTRLTGEGMMVGTASYMPPEQALSGEVTPRSDLYALGVLLYELVTGHPPFAGDDAVAVISQHINVPPVAPRHQNPGVPPALESLILRLLAKSPNDRPESAEAVSRTLADVSAVRDAPGESAAGNPLDRLAQSVFVGREPELEQLRKGVDAAIGGAGRVLLLVGEPGIGKTRTSEETTTYAAMRGAGVLWGRCYEGEGAPTYWPWVQIVRAHVQQSQPSDLLAEMGAGAGAIADVVSEVRERLPGLQTAPALDPEESRFRLFDSVTRFLRAAAERKPLVLVLDDLHWADKPSLLLLQFLARELAGARIAVLATYRDVELRRTHPLAEALGEIARIEGTERVLLRGIGEADVARFLELSTGQPPAPALPAAVHRETEGNPFFVQEVVRLLASQGRLDRASQTSTSLTISIPQGIREVIGRRLNELSEDCNRLLTIASVIGREFELAVLERVAGMPADRALELLEEAVAARVVEETRGGPGHFRFSHALVRETLQEELGTTRRVRLHREVGDVLEAHYGDKSEAHLAELAYHAVEGAHGGGDVAKAVDYATRAARRATALSAYEDAIPHYERALQALELASQADPGLRTDLLCELGFAQYWALDRDEAARTLEEAIAIARKLGDARRMARAAATLSAARSSLGEPVAESVAVLEEALEALGDQDSLEALEVLHALTVQLSLGETLLRARAYGDRALAMARRMDDPKALLLGLWTHGIAYLGRREHMGTGAEMVALADAVGDPHHQVFGRIWSRIAAITRGDRAAFDRLLDEEEQILARTQNPGQRANHLIGRAAQALFEADWARAERVATEAFQLGARVTGPQAVQMFGVQQSILMIVRGQEKELVDFLRASAEEHPQPAWLCALAGVAAVAGEEEDARRILHDFCDADLAGLPEDGNWWAGMALLCLAADVLGDAECAAVLHRHLEPRRGLLVNTGMSATTHGSTSVYVAALCGLLGRFEEGAAHYEEGTALLDGFGARYNMGESRLAGARLFERAGNTERALEELNEALDLGRRYDMEGIVRRALAHKLELQGALSSEVTGSIHTVTASVHAKPLDLSARAAPDGTVTLMFSDMEGFTAMTERLGDVAAREVIRSHNRIVREQLAAHDGYEVELQGDGFLLAFASARRALHCAIGIQRTLEAHNRQNAEPIRVRIGLHTGEALRDADKFFGKTVILASRIAAQAEGGEILVSAVMKSLTESTGDVAFGMSREVALKGIADPQVLYEVSWNDTV